MKQFSRDLVVTPKGIFLVGRELEKQKGGQSIEVEKITRKISFEKLSQVYDDFLLCKIGPFTNVHIDIKRRFNHIFTKTIGLIVDKTGRLCNLACSRGI